MTIHAATDVNTEVLLADAKKLGIVFYQSIPFNLSLDNVSGIVVESIYGLGSECDKLMREPKVKYPRKGDYVRYNVYQGGKVLGEELTAEQKGELMKQNPKALIEQVEIDDYRIDLDKYHTYQAMIRQTFAWGMYYIEDILDNPKAIKAFNIAWEHGHSAGYAEVANEFGTLLELIK
jgi:hypothetical protein